MTHRSILLVDDEEIILKSLGNLLEKEGYKVSQAVSAEAGLALFHENKHRLVITDLIMNGLGGLELVRRVKLLKPETQVLVITGCGDHSPTINALMENGADGYLLKPCGRKELLQKVTDCFNKLDMKYAE